jgi:hypothetical protein
VGRLQNVAGRRPRGGVALDAHGFNRLYLCFFFKKLLIVANLLRARSTFAQQSKLTRSLLALSLHTILSTLKPVSTSTAAPFDLPSRAEATRLSGIIAYSHVRSFIVFNFKKKLCRFIFFYFTTFMCYPLQHMQHTNNLAKAALYLPQIVLFLLLFANLDLDRSTRHVSRIMLI